ncbi:MAG: SMC-Scp complex subunit ScpB [Acidobacteria bacterium]|nr:SMC-Scp complex subunit ScpB [Acidobacteriota bacterium]
MSERDSQNIPELAEEQPEPTEAPEAEAAAEETAAPAEGEAAPEGEPAAEDGGEPAEADSEEAEPEEAGGEEPEPEAEAVADEEQAEASDESEQAETVAEDEAEDEASPDEENAEGAEGDGEAEEAPVVIPGEDERLALLEAIIYVSEEPLTTDQICSGLALPREIVEADLDRLVQQYTVAQRGVEVRKVAGGYRMYTKAEHHEAVRGFVKTLQAKLKLSKPAFETLAVIAYKQPITVPEIQAIRGVNASGTIHTLLKHKLITSAGRKKVIGKPMMYKTTREFLVQFGLDDLGELPTLKEFEEQSRAALVDESPDEAAEADAPERQNGEETPEQELAESEEAEETDEPAAEEEAQGGEEAAAEEGEQQTEEEEPKQDA